jgi:hypothetical protein
MLTWPSALLIAGRWSVIGELWILCDQIIDLCVNYLSVAGLPLLLYDPLKK